MSVVNPAGTFINGPDGKLEAKYVQGKSSTAPTVLILHPHPEYGGTMNNKVVYNAFHTFLKNGQGELSDAAAVLDWIQRQNPNTNESWIVGFSFGSLICMQLLMRRPEIYRFIAICPQPNIYDFNFLAPCPSSGMVLYSSNDQLVPPEATKTLETKLKNQKSINVDFVKIEGANHFFAGKDKEFCGAIEKYIKKESRF
jgi:alpha/beta superfamily hydrolase